MLKQQVHESSDPMKWKVPSIYAYTLFAWIKQFSVCGECKFCFLGIFLKLDIFRIYFQSKIAEPEKAKPQNLMYVCIRMWIRQTNAHNSYCLSN